MPFKCYSSFFSVRPRFGGSGDQRGRGGGGVAEIGNFCECVSTIVPTILILGIVLYSTNEKVGILCF